MDLGKVDNGSLAIFREKNDLSGREQGSVRTKLPETEVLIVTQSGERYHSRIELSTLRGGNFG